MLKDLPANVILYAVIESEEYDFAWNADKTNKVRTAEAVIGTEIVTEGNQDYLKITAASGDAFSGCFTLTVAEVEKVERTIEVTAVDANGAPLAGVPVSIKRVVGDTLVDVTDSAVTDENGKAVFTNAELLDLAKNDRLVAEVGEGYEYAWTGAASGNTVRTATAGNGVNVHIASLQAYLDVTAEAGASFDGTFTISVRPAAN